ncbi:hypothetical protein [Pelagibius sp.]|uniref:hypothetical protein n=1 Tax=Pelagibius sp. TaxID=1931238 RepID=UPI003B514ED7
MAVQDFARSDLDERPENVPSELDDLTHAEMRMLYAESVEVIRFAKTQQWKSLGAILVVFVALIGLSQFAAQKPLLSNLIIALSFLCSGGVIYSMALYQAWQNTERRKLREIGAHLSSYAKAIRAVKSSREANVHRYTLLVFMIASVLMGNAMLVLFVSPLYR